MYGFGGGDGLHQLEEVLDGLRLGLPGLCRTAVGDGLHHLLADHLRRVGEVDAGVLVVGLGHLGGAVQSGDLHELAAEVVGHGQLEVFVLVDVVEPLREVTGHLEVLLLVFAHGHHVGVVEQNVGGHQHGVGEQAGVDVVGLAAHLLLEGGHALQFADIDIHGKQQRELAHLRHVALHVDGRLFGIEARRDILDEDIADVGL